MVSICVYACRVSVWCDDVVLIHDGMERDQRQYGKCQAKNREEDVELSECFVAHNIFRT
ncbi:hypothetical protein VCR15J2_50134 [Vibrio coralliirubri]|nr:hypothetical protein VCR15J2_50134 [Vibrio coralliirubri]